MSLIRYEPMNVLSRMQGGLSRFFNHNDDDLFPSLRMDDDALFGGEWLPRVDLEEDDKNYIVTADVPGVDPQDLEVTMEGGLLTIRGERRSEKEETKKHYRRKECMYGSFERSFLLPDTADGDRITATSRNGVVTIEIPKKEAAQRKAIKIETH